MFGPLHSNINKEQYEKHLYNPSSHFIKYERFTHKTHTPYLDAYNNLNFSHLNLLQNICVLSRWFIKKKFCLDTL